MSTLTANQVLALAPDPASAKAGQGLANTRKWVSVGGNDKAIWGECQGSGSSPYQARVELGGLAAKCSCPSRKFPCKHSLGLMLIAAAEPAKFQNGTPPAWVVEWLGQREQRVEKASAKTSTPPADPAATQAEGEKRARKREERVADGLEEMEQWIKDLVRVGLAHCQNEPLSFWDNKAARLVDAQASGVARRVENLATVVRTGTGWHERMLEEMSLLYLLRAAHRKLEGLTAPRQADVRRHLGWTTKQEDVLANPGLLVEDTWEVIGQIIEKEDRLTTQRTWVRGSNSARFALLLNFAVPGQPLDSRAIPGRKFSGSLAFYESSFPLRALIKDFGGSSDALTAAPSGAVSIGEAFSFYAAALAGDPWLESFPLCVAGVTTVQTDSGWLMRELAGTSLPLARNFSQAWKLHAIGGGHPLTVTGEWNGRAFLPISAFTDGRFISLT
jgi:hypothetical protein